MKDIRGIILFFVLVLLLVIPACSSSRSGGHIQDKEKEIELTTKDHSVKAIKIAPLEDTFVLFTVNPVLFPDSLKYLDARIIVIAKKEADQLKAKYGSFVVPENKGHSIARGLTKHYSLIAADRTVQKQIKKLIDLNSHRFFPVIKLSMTELNVTELYYNKSKVMLSGEIGKQYLVKKIEILEENYPL
jgi:hypothetical protein